MKKRKYRKTKSANNDSNNEKDDQSSPQLARRNRIKRSKMEVAIYVSGSLFAIAAVIAALFGTLGHRDLCIWTSFVAVCLAVLAGFCWLQNFHWKKDERQPNKPEERPYLWVKNMIPKLENFGASEDTPIVELVFENTGTGPAYDVTPIPHEYIASEKLSELPPPPRPTDTQQRAGTFLPQNREMTHVLGSPKEASPELKAQIERGERFFYVFGSVTYANRVDNRVYKLNFCGLYSPKENRFQRTAFGNETD